MVVRSIRWPTPCGAVRSEPRASDMVSPVARGTSEARTRATTPARMPSLSSIRAHAGACMLYVLLLLAPRATFAQQAAANDSLRVPTWAFPGRSADLPLIVPPFDSTKPLRIPGSARSFTLAQVRDQLRPPDWQPRSHPAPPASVMRARADVRYACGYCHLPDGGGRSENATLAGLSSAYIVRQVEAFRSGARRGAGASATGPVANMIAVSTLANDEEIAAAARYFTRLRPRARYRVAERAMIPAMYEAGGLYAERAGADSEPIAGRLLEMTESLERHELRDPDERFVTFVAPGTIALGRQLALGAPASPSCASCHGAGLRGTRVAPPIAGRSAAYILRQLLAFRTGARANVGADTMRVTTASLSVAQMVALAAYVGSLAP